jgi:glutaredoxin-like YruB-family protein
MKIKVIDGYNALKDSLKGQEKAYLLLYKEGNDTSECALENLTEAAGKIDDLLIMTANVANVRDIHPVYEIKTVPTLISFENGNYKNVIKGCQSVDFYKNLFEESLFVVRRSPDEKPQKRVTVYSTPTCSWCNTLKAHLRHHNIRFTDIDVSRDQAAAQAMVARSGQQGVPQTDINGEIIIGFDKKRINELLEINA